MQDEDRRQRQTFTRDPGADFGNSLSEPKFEKSGIPPESRVGSDPLV